MPSILFVCTGNLCRSPIAAALFRARLQAMGSNYQSWIVESAGIWAPANQPAAPFAQQVMAKRGLDLSQHYSREVDEELLSKFDLILTMEAGQKEALIVEFSKLSSRVFMLSEMAGSRADIRDPMGHPIQSYEHAAEMIEHYLNRSMDQIIQFVQSTNH